jgi:hypothetical protein
MSAGARVLALWLTPGLLFGLPALILERGVDGLWVGLTLVVVPLIALGAGASNARAPREPAPSFHAAALVLTVSGLLWGCIALAADAAAWLGVERWQAVAVTAISGWAVGLWRGMTRVVPVLLVLALAGLAAPLTMLALDAGVTPLTAWERLASQPAFRFPVGSPWVTAGRDLGTISRIDPLRIEEEQRIVAPVGGTVHVRTRRGTRVANAEWRLGPGESAVLRPGDELDRSRPLPLRFEAGKRIPGAPASGMVWAEMWTYDWGDRIGLHLTLLLGGLALVRGAVRKAFSRRATVIVGGGLAFAFVWAQGWALYAALGAPDVFLGGPDAVRLLDLRALGRAGHAWSDSIQATLLGGGLACFLASSIALRQRVAAADLGAGGGAAVWAAVFAAIGIASLRPVDPWWLVVLALGIAAAALGPAAIWQASGPRAVNAAAVVGLAVFTACAAGGELRRSTTEADDGRLAAAVQAYPALAAAPAGAIALWAGRRFERAGRRPKPSK